MNRQFSGWRKIALWTVTIVVPLAFHTSAAAQESAQSGTPPPTAPAFDVVSVKPSGSTVYRPPANTVVTMRVRGFRYTPGRVTCDLPLEEIIREAYSIKKAWQISGPAWLSEDTFEFAATMPPDTPKDTVRLMLRTMMAERFEMKVHFEQKNLSVYALVVAKGGPKLNGVLNPTTYTSQSGGGYYAASAMRLESLADNLRFRTDCPVIDATEIKGYFKIDLHWTPDYEDSPDGRGRRDRGMLSVLEEQLGLKLERRKMPVEVLVIDHVNRVPTPN